VPCPKHPAGWKRPRALGAPSPPLPAPPRPAPPRPAPSLPSPPPPRSMSFASVGGKDAVILGTMRSSIGGYPYLLALDAGTGALIWGTKIEDNPAATVTMSPTVYQEGKAVFVGLSSLEEARSASVNYTCCSFHGSFVKVRPGSGPRAAARAGAGQGRGLVRVWPPFP
jgi:hypothetical protein